MSAPTSPDLAELAYRSETEALLEVLRQFRRVETAAGGSPAVNTVADTGGILALTIQSARSVVTAQGGTPGTKPGIVELAYFAEVPSLLELLRQCRLMETQAGGAPLVLTDTCAAQLRALIVQSLRSSLTALGGTADTAPTPLHPSGGYADMVAALRGIETAGFVSNLTTFTVDGVAHTNGQTINLANGTTSVTIAATNGGSISNLVGDSGLSTGDNSCTFTVTAADNVTTLNVTINLHVLTTGTAAVQVLNTPDSPKPSPIGNWTLGDWTGDAIATPLPTGWNVSGTLGSTMTITSAANGSGKTPLTWDISGITEDDGEGGQNTWSGSVVQTSFTDGTDPI